MKKESLLMMIAGVVLGAVLGFIGTRQYYVDKMQKAPPPHPPHGEMGQASPAEQGAGAAQGAPAFDPNQHQAMLDQIKADLAKDPKNVEKRVMMGNIYFDGGKFAEAAPFYEEALKLDPKNADVVVDLGVCYRNTKRYDEALAKFDEALALDPGKKQALFNKVIVYAFDKGEKAKASEILKTLKAQYPDDQMVKQLEQELSK